VPEGCDRDRSVITPTNSVKPMIATVKAGRATSPYQPNRISGTWIAAAARRLPTASRKPHAKPRLTERGLRS
jgi:hypothetical protein